MEENSNVCSKAVELLGEAMPVSRQPKKETIMSFKKGPVYMGLKIVSPFNKETQEYEAPIPKVVFLVDGKYVRLPLDSDLFRDWGEFLGKLSAVTDGVRVPEKEVNMKEVMAKLSCLKGAS